MSLQLIGFTLDFIGKILIAISVLLVHSRVARENKIDKHIVKQIEREKWMTVFGIVLMAIGFLLQVQTKL